jgi:hypothetical protein
MIKILTKKKLIKILKLLVANGYIFDQKCDDFECLDKYVQNEADITYEIGGIDGLYLAKELREAMRKKV